MDLEEKEHPESDTEAPRRWPSGALDEIFTKIDAGELDLTGRRRSDVLWALLRDNRTWSTTTPTRAQAA